MSLDEMRQAKAMALLEVEEAEQEYAALKARATALHALLTDVCDFAFAMTRPNANYENSMGAARRAFDSRAPEMEAALNFTEILALDSLLGAAQLRLAEAKRKRALWS